ncbi:hypothetical protein B7494_g7830 [Chlorociboria aeruginascens]|nr:hypothetical protein B7494_g7830 [Chlorociboria aeruginascens]
METTIPVEPVATQAENVKDGDRAEIMDDSASTPISTNPRDLIEDFDVDSNPTDTDSGILMEDRPSSSTASVDPSLYEPIMRSGRSYHRYKHGKYFLPNDESEQNRLDLQHQLWLMTLHGRLHLAPIRPDLSHVLDIGTGTGIWAIEFVKSLPFPSKTHVSKLTSAPPNCHFEIDDAEDEWVYRQKFDYIHGRLMVSCFNDASSVFRKAYDGLQPGGYFEMQDALTITSIDSSGEDSALMRWVTLMIEAAKKLGRDFEKVKRYKGWMEEAGFEEVSETYFAWPTNTWPRGEYHKSLGVWANADFQEGLEGFSLLALERAMGMSKEEVNALLVDVRRDLNDRNIHAYMPMLVVYGRKPF